MSGAVENRGEELPFFITRGSDCVITLEFFDADDVLRNITTLLFWVEGVDESFSSSMVEPGSFTVTLPRSVTVGLDSVTEYTIGFIDEATMHQPLLRGQIRLTHGRLGT